MNEGPDSVWVGTAENISAALALQDMKTFLLLFVYRC